MGQNADRKVVPGWTGRSRRADQACGWGNAGQDSMDVFKVCQCTCISNSYSSVQRYISEHPNAFEAALDSEGFFKTGDLAEKCGAHLSNYVIHGRASVDCM